ncbi:MAG: helix-turn-helix transcriptional regulator [Paludibacteraceae bacterium]|nr:helix-turn-helix transcriptional regulator [Paludibacteraceae bacterium]
MKQEKLNIITIQDFKKIPTLSFLDEEVMVVNNNDIYQIPKPSYPVRMKNFVVAFCISGKAQISINTINYNVSANNVMLLSPECVLTINEMESPKATFLVFSQKYGKEVISLCSAIWNSLDAMIRTVNHSVTEEEGQMILSYIKKLSDCCNDTSNKYRREIVKLQIVSFLHELCNACIKEDSQKSYLTREMQIFQNFFQLASQNFKVEHSVAFYADKLCISPKYLSMAVKQAVNKTPSETIQGFLIQEAKVLLKNTNMTIKQISNDLNFQNPSFFCRYFRKYVGVSPIEYRTKSF